MPEEKPCYCGCGRPTKTGFAPGHDLRAVMRIVRERYGSVEAFLAAHQEPAPA